MDDKDIGVMHHVNGPLYVLQWDPAQYTGLHYVTVIAKVQRYCVNHLLFFCRIAEAISIELLSHSHMTPNLSP